MTVPQPKQKARIWCTALAALAPTILATADLIRSMKG